MEMGGQGTKNIVPTEGKSLCKGMESGPLRQTQSLGTCPGLEYGSSKLKAGSVVGAY